jgi:hypothetical protein
MLIEYIELNLIVFLSILLYILHNRVFDYFIEF